MGRAVADLAKEFHDDVRRVGKEFPEKIKTVILAALTLGATLACNDWMKYLFEKMVGANNNGWAKFLHALIWLLALGVLSVKFSKKSEEADAPKKEEEKDKGPAR